MTRLFLLVIFGIVAAYYFPDSRAMLMNVAEPIIIPAVKWNTKEEMKQVGRNVVEHERLTGQLPDRRNWLPWLDYRYSSDDLKKDPWGSTYQLQVWSDSVAVISYGPDRTRQTEDDFRVVTPRERRRR